MKSFVIFYISFLFFSLNLPAQQDSALPLPLRSLSPVISSEDSAASIEAFRQEIDEILKENHLRKADAAIYIYSLTNGKVYFEKNISLPLTPASNTKLVTAFTAFYSLGKDFNIETTVYTDAQGFSDSTLFGNLYLYGRGDALLTISDIEQIADEIRNLGIKRIQGSIYADGSFFDNKKIRKEYSGDKDHVEKLPPLTSLCLEENTATVLVTSGTESGSPVNVQIIPPSEAFSVQNSAVVSASIFDSLQFEKESLFRKNENLRAGDKPLQIAYNSRRSIRVSTKMINDSIQKFYVSGRLPKNRSYSYRYHIQNPVLAAAGAFKQRLEAGGIEITGFSGVQKLSSLEQNTKIYKLAEYERNLTEILQPMMKESNNFLAEICFKIIGANAGKLSDNAQGSKETIQKTMENLAVPFEGCIINDGSGLSRKNLLTAESIVFLLRAADILDFKEEFRSCMAIAGIDGTLEKRMEESPATGKLCGKTGTLRNASSLSGYVETIDGEQLVFSLLFNGNSVWYYKNAEDKIGNIMAQFFYFNQVK